MLSERIFARRFDQISLEDLKNFFADEQEESSILEFKEGDVTLEKIYKEVCAFLNTEGGVIIIGTPRELEDSFGRKYCSGNLTPSKFRSGDWLIQKLSGNISPPPTGLKIRDFITESGNYFILEIPQSVTPPHQRGDGTYYIRLDKEAKGAPHGLVEALFFKRQKAKLKASATIKPHKEDFSLHTVTVTIRNESNFPAEKVSFSVTLKNIKSVIQSGFSTSSDEDNTHIHSQTLPEILWKEMNAKFSFDFEPYDQPLLVVINVWGRDSGVDKIFGIYDPLTKTMLHKTTDFENDGGLPRALELFDELIGTE